MFDGWHEHVMPTACKTWGCRICQVKRKAMFVMKVASGCSVLERSFFTTITYAMGYGKAKDAKSVSRDLGRLWEGLRATSSPGSWAWTKVPELTKAGQVHLHLIIGKVGKRKAMCEESPKSRKRWVERTCSLNCLAHEIAKAWREITKDSYVVDCSQVRSAGKVANYVAKYLSKGFAERAALDDRGFTNRFSTSRNWPGRTGLGLRGTAEGAWKGVTLLPDRGYYYREAAKTERSTCKWLEPVGDKFALKQLSEALIRKDLAILGRVGFRL